MNLIEDDIINPLLPGLRSSNEHAFNQLYQICFQPLYISVFSMVKDEEITNEILQELFIRIWQKRESFEPKDSFRAYLFKIARNLVADFYRKAAKDTKLAQKLITGMTEYYFHSDAVFEHKESSALLLEAVANLSPQRKAVFTLCKLEGKSYEDTSKALGISIATVNSHMTQALKTVKKYVLQRYQLKGILIIVGVICCKF